MRIARLVGLSPDGASLIVATDSGEELAIAADDRLRAAVRGDRPRLGQLEIQMESSLSPRDIQTRIRSGASLEDVARVAGLPIERVERFAAPVLAEREHVAVTAMSASVRRRGETAGHRNLRLTVTERLQGRGVDLDTIDWDAARREDGRWTVSADYRSGEAQRHAEFLFDLQGRFSVAGNDDAKWLLGEQSPARGPQPGRRRPEPVGGAGGAEGADGEPTLDLDDELALVRATREPPYGRSTPAGDPAADVGVDADQGPDEVDPDEGLGPDELGPDELVAGTARSEAAEPTVAIVRRLTAVEVTRVDDPDPSTSELDTLYAMLGGVGYSEDSAAVYPGLSDASAVPVVDDHDFEPSPAAVDFPVEPGEDEPPAEAPAEPAPEPAADESPTPDSTAADVGEAPDATGAAPTTAADDAPDADALIPGPAAPKKTAKRKRASVPSWDEIMFGGPKRS